MSCLSLRNYHLSYPNIYSLSMCSVFPCCWRKISEIWLHEINCWFVNSNKCVFPPHFWRFSWLDVRKMLTSRFLVKLIDAAVVLVRPDQNLAQTSCCSFESTSLQILKLNSICHFRRGPGKRTYCKNKKLKKKRPSKEQKENNSLPNTSLQDRVKNVSSGPTATPRKGVKVCR